MPGYARAHRHAQRFRKQQTDAEAILWQQLRNRKLSGHKFCRQVPIGPYIADFCCREKKLVIEIDGKIHNAQQEYDDERTEILKATGYNVVRFTNEQVLHGLPDVLQDILVTLRQ